MFSSKILLALPLLTSFVTSAPSFQLPIFNKNPLGSGSAAADGDVIDLSKYTIGEILDYTLAHHDDEKRHTPPLKKLSWVVNRTESFKEFVHNPDISVTLFAPDDEALTPPSRRGPGHGHDHDHEHEEMMMHMAAQGPHPFHTLTGTDFDRDDGDDNDDKDHEKKREAILKIVNAILYYHTGAQQYSKSELLDKQTLATSLNQTRDTDVAFRIRTAPRFELLPPPPSFDLSLNFYAKTRAGPAIQAKNGIIYLISAPLFPPLTPLDQLLAVPTFFSTLTSGIQLTELDRQIAPWIHHSHDHHSKLDAMLADKTHPMVLDVLQEVVEEVKASLAPSLPSKDDVKSFPLTVFAPSNRAFFKVPFEIKAFLFSPFGRPYLKKLLAFHVVPNVLFHSDYIVNATHKDATLAESISSSLPAGLERYVEAAGLGGGRGRRGQVKKQDGEHGKAGDKVDVAKYELATLLGNRKNESLAVNVYSYRLAFGKGPLVKRITVGRSDQDEHEYVHVTAGDATAWGGAIHVIGSLLSPYHPHEHDDHHHGHHHEHHGHHGHGHGHGHGHEDQVEYFKSLFA